MVELTRDWIVKSAPYLKFLSGTLSLALPISLKENIERKNANKLNGWSGDRKGTR